MHRQFEVLALSLVTTQTNAPHHWCGTLTLHRRWCITCEPQSSAHDLVPCSLVDRLAHLLDRKGRDLTLGFVEAQARVVPVEPGSRDKRIAEEQESAAEGKTDDQPDTE